LHIKFSTDFVSFLLCLILTVYAAIFLTSAISLCRPIYLHLNAISFEDRAVVSILTLDSFLTSLSYSIKYQRRLHCQYCCFFNSFTCWR